LLLDADQIVLRDPKVLFKSSEFKSYGAIFWPDYWGVTYDPDVIQLFNLAANSYTNISVKGEKVVSMNFICICDTCVSHLHQIRITLIVCLFSFSLDASKSSNPRRRDAIDVEWYVGHISYDEVDGSADFNPPRATHETGQILIDRERHFHALCLAYYFKIYPTNVFSVMLGGGIYDNGEKEVLAWAVTVLGGDYAIMEKPITLSDGQGRQMRAHVRLFGRGKAVGNMAPDGLLVFAHTNANKWKCCQVVGTLYPEHRRFSHFFGQSQTLDTKKGKLLSTIFQSQEFREAGGPPWVTDNDPEQLIWDYTQHVCKVSGEDAWVLKALNQLQITDATYLDQNIVCKVYRALKNE
jgi:hypothetical protein